MTAPAPFGAFISSRASDSGDAPAPVPASAKGIRLRGVLYDGLEAPDCSGDGESAHEWHAPDPLVICQRPARTADVGEPPFGQAEVAILKRSVCRRCGARRVEHLSHVENGRDRDFVRYAPSVVQDWSRECADMGPPALEERPEGGGPSGGPAPDGDRPSSAIGPIERSHSSAPHGAPKRR